MHLDLIISFTNSVGEKGLIEDYEWVTMRYYLSRPPCKGLCYYRITK